MIVFLTQILNIISLKRFCISLGKDIVAIPKGLDWRYYILIWWKFYIDDFNPVFHLLWRGQVWFFILLAFHWTIFLSCISLFQIILKSLNNYTCWFKTKNSLFGDHQLDCQTISWPSTTMVIITWNFFLFDQIFLLP